MASIVLTRRQCMATVGATLFAPALSLATEAKYEEIGWPALLPAGWNPGKFLRELQALGELPDDDARVVAASQRARKALDAAPTVASLNGRRVKLPGFVVPLEAGRQGRREFLLVPYFGACIHVPAPPANQVVHVFCDEAVKGLASMSTVWASGVLKVERSTAAEEISGYRMHAARVERYQSR